MITDPISDMLTRMRNALAARHAKVDVPASKIKLEIARILRDEGYITNYKISGEGARKSIRIYLRYGPKGESVINHLERVSKPSCRRYVAKRDIPSVLGGLGISIISTSKGVMTGKQARKQNLGGELICKIY
ncbi:MAG: 30S ribosomal protein S8 [Acidobacteriota bacterium]|nr:30S ribosomal protein S8 [Blastocatellia bacterium]MDW8412639.1 30S ribosomal protein S8 [Acidobacteriota bacterium]